MPLKYGSLHRFTANAVCGFVVSASSRSHVLSTLRGVQRALKLILLCEAHEAALAELGVPVDDKMRSALSLVRTVLMVGLGMMNAGTLCVRACRFWLRSLAMRSLKGPLLSAFAVAVNPCHRACSSSRFGTRFFSAGMEDALVSVRRSVTHTYLARISHVSWKRRGRRTAPAKQQTNCVLLARFRSAVSWWELRCSFRYIDRYIFMHN